MRYKGTSNNDNIRIERENKNSKQIAIEDIARNMSHEIEWKRMFKDAVIENMQEEIAWLRRGIDIYRAERPCPCNDSASWKQDECPVCMWESNDDARARVSDDENGIRSFSRIVSHGSPQNEDLKNCYMVDDGGMDCHGKAVVCEHHYRSALDHIRELLYKYENIQNDATGRMKLNE